MKKVIMLLSLFAVLSFGLMIVTNQYNTEGPVEKTGNIESCPNFNFQDFVKTGGSKTTESRQEAIDELLRVRWLCSGGNS